VNPGVGTPAIIGWPEPIPQREFPTSSIQFPDAVTDAFDTSSVMVAAPADEIASAVPSKAFASVEANLSVLAPVTIR
jgi:hypothetical protein